MPDPEFQAPATLDDALEMLAVDGAMALAGGTSVVMMLNDGLVDPTSLVWLGRLEELRGISELPDGMLRLGALTRLQEIADSQLVQQRHPALAQAAAVVGNPRVRAAATLGGALVHADPRQDVPPALLALDARLQISGPAGPRVTPVAGFFLGLMETALAPGEMVTAVVLPAPASGERSLYLRYTPGSHDDFPTVGVAVRTDPAGGEASIGLAGVAPTPLLVRAPPGAAPALVQAACDPVSDRLGSAAYKRAMAGVWTSRALQLALEPPAPPIP